MNSRSQPLFIHLNIGDQLTSISCGQIVSELIKFLVYQRLQIPYSYQWLKQTVNNKKTCVNPSQNNSFHSERHFRVVSTALENLDHILKSLLQEINGTTIPQEVCILLGGTPYTAKEAYRLVLPNLCHKEQCHSPHIASDQKIKQTVFQTLATSETLSKVMLDQLPPTNMHVFIRKHSIDNKDLIVNYDNFMHASGFRISNSSKIVIIDFRSKNQITCCNEFKIFGDIISNDLNNLYVEDSVKDGVDEYREIDSTDSVKWYQSAYVMKGFKDYIVNGSSITNIWNQP